ncbi:hypothetical protein HAX54_035240 [Datura stramonium]|uniref:Uncharacterized protein n=1 Tax=Datura stramonium TaxID=4076 RepID=A0ABS8SF55_DATST|nr:hypothetical protein [Datura stramonium]
MATFLQGTFPEELGLLTDLGIFHINSNRFCGTIPRKFKNLKILFELDSSNNSAFPASIGEHINLNEAILMNNGLRSCLPAEIGLLENLTVFDVSFNQLMGPLPENFGQLVNLEQLNVAHNMLSGTI